MTTGQLRYLEPIFLTLPKQAVQFLSAGITPSGTAQHWSGTAVVYLKLCACGDCVSHSDSFLGQNVWPRLYKEDAECYYVSTWICIVWTREIPFHFIVFTERCIPGAEEIKWKLSGRHTSTVWAWWLKANVSTWNCHHFFSKLTTCWWNICVVDCLLMVGDWHWQKLLVHLKSQISKLTCAVMSAFFCMHAYKHVVAVVKMGPCIHGMLIFCRSLLFHALCCS